MRATHFPAITGSKAHGWRPGGIQRLIIIASAIALVLSAVGSLVEPASAAPYRTTAALNLRTGPGVDFPVVRVIPSVAAVDVTGAAENGFLPLTYEGSSGYASANFLTSGSSSGSATGPTGVRYVVDGRLNLRSGAGGSYGVILVLPDGASVQLTGEVANGYSKVTYNGTTGWAFTSFLSASGGSGTNGGTSGGTGSSVAVGDTVTGSATTSTRLNLRQGPGTAYGTVLTIPNGATVEVMGSAQSGFLPVRYNGTKGWASATYLQSGGSSGNNGSSSGTNGSGVAVGDTVAGSATTTVNLNLRRGPGTGYTTLLTIPRGARVDVMGTSQSGFLPVRYNGTKGWASSDFLQAGGSSGDSGSGNGNSGAGVAVGDTVTGSATTTARLNLRRGPGTSYGTILTMNSGVRVDVMGSAQGGFLPVRVSGTKGWASADFLTTGVSPGNGNTGNGSEIEDQVTTRSVNMRSSPNTSSSVVWLLPPGTRIDVTGAAQNGYYPAKWAHVSGWVHRDFLIPLSQHSDPGASTSRDQQMIAIIYQAADKWGQSRTDMLRVARCESWLDPNVVNPRSGTSGLFQFRPSTFAITPNGKRGENIFDPWSNADAAGWMWANGMRNHWACQ